MDYRAKFYELSDKLGYPIEIQIDILMECIKQIGSNNSDELYKLCLSKVTNPAYKEALKFYEEAKK